MKNHRTQRWLVSLLLAAGLFGCKGAAPAEGADAAKVDKPAVAVEAGKAVRQTIRETLDLSGSFVPSQGNAAKLTPAVPGRVAQVYVREGDAVQKGQVLATLDTHVQQSQQMSAKAAAAAAQSQARQSQLNYQVAQGDQLVAVQVAENGLQGAELERTSAIAQAANAYEAALADLSRTRAGARPQEIAQAHQMTIQARVARDRAATEYDRNQTLATDGLVSKRQLEDAKAAMDTTEAALAGAEQAESLLKAGARSEDLRSAEARAAAARAALSSAKALGEQRVRAARLALHQAKQGELNVQSKLQDVQSVAQLAIQRQADAAAASATTALSEIRAPYSGHITRRILNPGDAADTTTPILEIGHTRGGVDFLANAVTSQAVQIRAGMEAEIDVKDSTISARVLSVSPADPLTGLSAVRLASPTFVLPGTFSVCHIVLRQIPNAIAVPNEALLDHDGKTVVLKVVDGAVKQVEVKTGAQDQGLTQVLNGIAPGDVVVKLGGYELSDGDKVKIAEPADKAPDAKGSGG